MFNDFEKPKVMNSDKMAKNTSFLSLMKKKSGSTIALPRTKNTEESDNKSDRYENSDKKASTNRLTKLGGFK